MATTYTRVIENLVLTKTMRLEGPEWDNTLIRNVTIKDVNGDGFFLKNVKNVKIENCTVNNVSGVGIKLSSEGSTQNVIIEGNKVSNIGRDGLSAAQRTGVDHPGLQVLNNTFDKTGLSGSSGLLHGIYVQSTDFVIKGNHVTNSMDGNGISVRSSGLVANNVVEYTGKSGIAYYADHMRGPSDLLTIENNLVMDSGNRETSRNDIDLLNIPNTSNVVRNFIIRNNNIVDTSDGVKVHSDYAKLGISPKVSANDVLSMSAAKSLISSILSGSTSTTSPIDATKPAGDGSATVGTSGADTLTGTAGNDTLTGGAGGDTFVITKGMGSDTITDFYPQWSDVIKLTDYGLTSFDQVKPLLTQSGADTVLKFANGETLTLKNVKATDLAASEFAFDNAAPAPAPAPAPTTGKTITGTSGADTLTGTAGNDTLTGGAGGDTFVITKGMGSDTITDFYPQWSDVIKLTDYGITSFDQVKPLLTQSGADTVLKFANGETLTLKNVNATNLAASEFAFDNAAPAPAPAPAPVAGKTITGTSGADTLVGTAGNDTLTGGAGGDTFVITKGMGSDTITDFYPQWSDVIKLTDYGITSFDQVKPLLSQSGADTVLKFANGETLTLKNVNATDLAASEFAFDNTASASASTAAPAPAPAPVAGKTITGTSGADTLVGTAGNDTLTGGAGGDTFVITKGMGSDTITDFYPQWSDVIKLTDYGITSFDQVKPLLSQSGADTVLEFANGETLTLQNVNATDLAASEFAFDNGATVTLLGVTDSQPSLDHDAWA